MGPRAGLAVAPAAPRLARLHRVRHLVDPEYAGIFSGITVGSHEFGHLVFAPFGELLAVAGGSLMQVLVPIGAAALLASRRDYFGGVVALCWLSFSLTELPATSATRSRRSCLS